MLCEELRNYAQELALGMKTHKTEQKCFDEEQRYYT